MGIEFITKKSQKFGTVRDAAFEDEFMSTNLFSAVPDATSELFRCKAVPDAMPEVGTAVLLYSTGAGIKVFHLNNQVGTVMSPDAAALKKKMADAHTEVVAAIVAETRPVSNIFLVHPQSALP